MKIARRYAPFTAFLTALVLLLLFVPSTSTTSRSGASGMASSQSQGVVGVPTPGSGGRTVAGIACAPGVRQVPWSAYAPECVPAWHGNNGGATAPGVTGSTITVVYRQFSSSDLQEIYSLLPKDVIGTNQQGIDSLQAMINVFNQYFELYGRKVVLKVFTGQGNLINEITGTGAAEAEADAATARSLGAFADLSIADTSPFYVDSLSNFHIISFPTDYDMTADSYLKAEPYIYTQGPDCTKTNLAVTGMIGNGMANMPAIYAGDPAYHSKTRTFGIFYNNIPTAASCEQELVDDLKRVGVVPAVVSDYTFSPSQLTEQISTAVEQMKAAGVTTVIEPDEDPVTPGLLMSVAQADGYFPEWVFTPSVVGGYVDADAILRTFAKEAPQEMAHLILPGIVSTPIDRQEDYVTFYKGMPGGNPLPAFSMGWFYAPVLLLFSAIQMAGPHLTPQTFQAAFHHLTDSASNGMYGQWVFGPTVADPANSFQITYWDPNAVSNQDGQQGAVQACNQGRSYTFTGVPHELPKHVQLACYGNR